MDAMSLATDASLSITNVMQFADGSSLAERASASDGSVTSGVAPGPAQQLPLEGFSPQELEALKPLARGGVALLVRDANSGMRARITVMVHTRASMATVLRVISRVEEYDQIMDGVRDMEVTSRTRNRIGFHFVVGLSVFDVETSASLHIQSPQRVNGQFLRSTLGPGGLRWDLYPDERGGSFIAYSSWGDPSQGNWFLRTIARVAPSTIAAMQVSYDTVLALSASRRAEQLESLATARRPTERFVPAGALAVPSGAWISLAEHALVGGVVMSSEGVMSQSFVAMSVPSASSTVLARFADVSGYPRVWNAAIRSLNIVSENSGQTRFRTVVETPVFHTEGEQLRVLERVAGSGTDAVCIWRGLTGDYQRDEQRFDIRANASGGTTVVLTGGADHNRVGFVARTIMARDVWMTPGYSLAWKMVWLAAGLTGL
jgi:hypothetical protein